MPKANDARLTSLEKTMKRLELVLDAHDKRMKERDRAFFKLRDEEIALHVAPILEGLAVMRRRQDKLGGDIDFIRQKVNGQLVEKLDSITAQLDSILAKLSGHPASEPPIIGG